MSYCGLKWGILAKGIEKVSHALSWGSLVIIPLMMGLVMVDVVVRFVFNAAIFGAREVEGMMFLFMSFCGFAYCWIKGGHVRMNLIISRVGGRARAGMDALAAACGTFMFALILWRTAQETIVARKMGAATMDLGLPEYPFYLAMAILAALFTLQLLTSVISAILRAVR